MGGFIGSAADSTGSSSLFAFSIHTNQFGVTNDETGEPRDANSWRTQQVRRIRLDRLLYQDTRNSHRAPVLIIPDREEEPVFMNPRAPPPQSFETSH